MVKASYEDVMEPVSEHCMKGAFGLPEVQRIAGVNSVKESCSEQQLIRVVPPKLFGPFRRDRRAFLLQNYN